MTEIVRMTRYGSVYTILLECGHKIERTKHEVKLQQLYVGKRIGCAACEELEEAW